MAKDRSEERRESIARLAGIREETPEQSTPDPGPTPDVPTTDPHPTPARNVRISDRDWTRLKQAAAAEGTSAGAIIRRLVREYLRR